MINRKLRVKNKDFKNCFWIKKEQDLEVSIVTLDAAAVA